MRSRPSRVPRTRGRGWGGGGGPGPAPVAGPTPADVSKVRWRGERIHSFWLLPPSALMAIRDSPIKWILGQFPFSPLPLSSFCVLRCDRWDGLSPDPSCFPKWDRRSPNPVAFPRNFPRCVCPCHLASVEPRPQQTRDTTGPPPQLPPQWGRHQGASGRGGQHHCLPVAPAPAGFPRGPLCRQE